MLYELVYLEGHDLCKRDMPLANITITSGFTLMNTTSPNSFTWKNITNRFTWANFTSINGGTR